MTLIAVFEKKNGCIYSEKYNDDKKNIYTPTQKKVYNFKML